MNVIRIESSVPRPETLSPEPGQPTSNTESAQQPYDGCDQCGAPLDRNQRYCVTCGARHKHVPDPAAQFLASATGRSRSGTASRAPVTTSAKRSSGLGTAVVLAVIPLAVGLGVFVGGSGTHADDKLIAALRAQKAQVVTVAGTLAGAPPSSAGVSASPITSDFSLQSGYAVELQTLAQRGASDATVRSAKHALEAKGATAVGVINQSDFRVTPSPPAGAYVLYSGQYKAKAAAVQALAKLVKRFPGAKLIAVQSSASSSGSAKVLATSNYGSAHQISGFKPSQAQLSSGAQIAKKIGQEIGSNYVGSQKGLPDSISVP